MITTGFNHLIRPCMYGSYHHIINLTNPRGELRPYVIAGNICESGDVFTKADGETEGYVFPQRASEEPHAGAQGDSSAPAPSFSLAHAPKGSDRPGTRLLPALRPGDALAICGVGAYGFVMASEYNLRPRPAEVVVVCGPAQESAESAGAAALRLAPAVSGLHWQCVRGEDSEGRGGLPSEPCEVEAGCAATPASHNVAFWAVSRAALTVEQLVEEAFGSAS